MWRSHVLPRLVDLSLRGHEVGERRALTCAGLSGRVLELGFGSGLNVRWYPPEVTEVHAVEPEDVAWGLSERRRARTSLPVVRSGLDGQHLAAADASYDGVLITFTLCTIPDAEGALAEVRRVLRPGGSVHVLEHGLAPEPGVVRWQRRLEPAQRRFAGGCHLTRDPFALLGDAGFVIQDRATEYLTPTAAGRPWQYLYRARATAR